MPASQTSQSKQFARIFDHFKQEGACNDETMTFPLADQMMKMLLKEGLSESLVD